MSDNDDLTPEELKLAKAIKRKLEDSRREGAKPCTVCGTPTLERGYQRLGESTGILVYPACKKCEKRADAIMEKKYNDNTKN